MTTQQVTIQTSAPGATQTRRQLLGVGAALSTLGKEARGTFLPILGVGVLSGIVGGSLLGMALAGGSAANSMVVLQSALIGLLDPLISLIPPLVEWFTLLPSWAQYAIIAAGAALLMAGQLARLGKTLFTVAKALFAVTKALFSVTVAGRGAFLTVLKPLLVVGAALGLVLLLLDGLIREFPRLGQVLVAVENAVQNLFNDLVNGLIDSLNLIFRLADAAANLISTPHQPRQAVQSAFDAPQVLPNLPRLPDREFERPTGPSLAEQLAEQLADLGQLLTLEAPDIPVPELPEFPTPPGFDPTQVTPLPGFDPTELGLPADFFEPPTERPFIGPLRPTDRAPQPTSSTTNNNYYYFGYDGAGVGQIAGATVDDPRYRQRLTGGV